MATFYSDFQTKVRAATTALHTRPSLDDIQMTRRRARFIYTPTGTELNTEFVVLGSLGLINARVIPEECKIRFTGSGTIDSKFTLKKQNTAGTIVALAAVTSTVSALTSTITMAAIAGAAADTIPLAQTDELIVVFTTGASAVTLPATCTIIFEIAYDTWV